MAQSIGDELPSKQLDQLPSNLHEQAQEGEAISIPNVGGNSTRKKTGNSRIKAKFQFDFPNNQIRVQAANVVWSYYETGVIDWLKMDHGENTIKLEGEFDAKEILHKLRSLCRTGVVVYEKTFSEMPAAN